ncbi:MAG TPA: AraC family transcriptional regulator [Thermoanaerobaculia bacterium]|nr:AraC family transcriptional regulator [Thermoanaerobaculia bacterium]
MYLSPTTHGDRVRTREAGRFVLYQSTYAPATALPRHYHDIAALMFSSRGAFAETVGGRTFEAAPYDVIVRPAGEVHTNRYNAGGASCVIVNVPHELCGWIRTPSLLPRRAVAPLAHRVTNELATDDEAAPLVLEGLLLELIGAGLRTPSALRAPSWLVRARDFIHEHATERVTLREIANAADVHPASLVRAFRAHLRCTPGDYVRTIRIEEAKRALMTTSRTAAEIALDAGFYDQSHFTNAFRRATGMTPREYRNAFRPSSRRSS